MGARIMTPRCTTDWLIMVLFRSSCWIMPPWMGHLFPPLICPHSLIYSRLTHRDTHIKKRKNTLPHSFPVCSKPPSFLFSLNISILPLSFPPCISSSVGSSFCEWTALWVIKPLEGSTLHIPASWAIYKHNQKKWMRKRPRGAAGLKRCNQGCRNVCFFWVFSGYGVIKIKY